MAALTTTINEARDLTDVAALTADWEQLKREQPEARTVLLIAVESRVFDQAVAA